MNKDIKKILIVDDDPICLKAVKTLLIDNYQCKVDVAVSATQALNRIYEMGLEWEPKWYDLIFMDINMPVLNGDKVTKIIKETEANMKTIPVIAITTADSAKRQNEFLKLGITEVLIKPITVDQLKVVMKKYLGI
jgi:two-component system sensor histidine kinase/response regulator